MMALSVCFVATLAFAAFVLWLRDRQPRAVADEVSAARRAAAEALAFATRAKAAYEEQTAAAVDTLSRRFTQAKAELDEAHRKHRAEVEGIAQVVRSEQNQLAAAVGLMRLDGKPFAGVVPPNGTTVAEVLR